jgi:hypothetical protein
MKKSSIAKILIILLGHLWIVELTYISIFAFKFTLRYLQPVIVTTPAANLSLVSLTPVANLPPVSTTLVKLEAKFAAGVVDTGGAP